jgi:hypothetical protein
MRKFAKAIRDYFGWFVSYVRNGREPLFVRTMFVVANVTTMLEVAGLAWVLTH